MNTKPQFSPTIRKALKGLLERQINEVFFDAHEMIGTKSGDITPDQSQRLETLINELHLLLMEQTAQNL